MGVPFSDEASLRWALLGFEFLIGLALIYNSQNQPFPRPSSRFGWLVVLLATLILIGQAAPKPMTVFAHFIMLSGVGGWAGIGLAAGLTEDTAGLGAVGAYKALHNYTRLGCKLTVFSL